MRHLRLILFPFSFLYYLITRFRNHLYNIGYLKSFKFEVAVISVGNLSLGGTGKTPMVEYLIRLLSKKYKISTLSRGYGRKTKGFILADESSDSKVLGDEPRQIYLKYKDSISVSVGEERAWAIPEILMQKPETEVILMDDAFQHRAVVPDINILLSDYKNPFYEDFLLPAGNLRESRKGAKRADLLVITKCPEDISLDKLQKIKNRSKKYLKKDTPVYFSAIQYLAPERVFSNIKWEFSPNIILFSGIGKAHYLEQYVKRKYQLLKYINFPDHHNYSIEDILRIKEAYEKSVEKNISILTTEKDMVKIKEMNLEGDFKSLPLFYLPIEIKFIHEPVPFNDLIKQNLSPGLKQK